MHCTGRTRWIIILAATTGAGGILLRQEPLALSGLSVLVWVSLVWVNFWLRTTWAGNLAWTVRRTIDGKSQRSLPLVFRREARVELELEVPSRLRGLRLWIEDRMPRTCSVEHGSASVVFDVDGSPMVRWAYTICPQAIAKSTAPGIHVLITDRHGLFFQQKFFALPQDMTILPYLVRPQPTASILKRQNVQMMAGSHRYRKSGLSMELLGIRQYQMGDPPRWIAWKPTARLGRLMSCEYESEVPIRATLFVDLSPQQYSGRPSTSTADHIIAASASIARLLMSDRDPVACLAISQRGRHWLPHGLGERHLTRMLHVLLSAAPDPPLEKLDPETLADLAWSACQWRYPELADAARTFGPRLLRWGMVRHARQLRLRQQLCLVFAALEWHSTGDAYRMLLDDSRFEAWCRRLLGQHKELVELPVAAGDARIEWPSRQLAVDAICQGLVHGVARARDNELFVIFGTVPEQAAHRDALERSLRVARAAYHRVIFVHADPAVRDRPIRDPVARRILSQQVGSAVRNSAEAWLERLLQLGVKFARLDEQQLVEAVAAEVGLLQSGRIRASR